MSVWGSPERFQGITSAAELRHRPDELVAQIADALATAGEYATRIDMLPTQRLVDFKWAAHQAARRLGMRISIDVQLANVDSEGFVPIRVTPKEPPE